jgi:hypothetical protein
MYDTQRFKSALTKLTETARRGLAVARKLRRIEILGLALLLLPAALVIGSDIFSDVPNNHPFHNDINAIYGARVTVGCGPGVYCPDAAVTRGQMAAFLNRSLGRVSFDANPDKSLSTSYVELAVVTMKTSGGAGGGTGYVKVDANVYASTVFTSGCPCIVRYYIEEDISGDRSDEVSFNLFHQTAMFVASTASGSLSWVFQVPTQTIRTYRLKAVIYNGGGTPPPASARGILSAVYLPFVSSTFSPTIAPPEGDSAPRLQSPERNQ